MSASRPFQGDTGEGGDFSSQRAGGRGGGPKVGAARGTSRLQGQSYEILRDSAASHPLFFASARGGSPCSAAFVPPRLRRSKSCAFFVLSPLFFRRSPALFSFGGRIALLRGVKCAVPRARVSHTRQSLFVFFLHRFTHPAQHADYLHIAGEGFVFSSSPRSSLPHGGRHSGQQAQWARREIGQFLLMLR